MPRRVRLETGVRRAAAATPLIEEHDAIARGIEEPSMVRRASAAGAAVKEHGRPARGIAADLPVDLVAVAHGEAPVLVRLDARVERAPRGHRVSIPHGLPERVALEDERPVSADDVPRPPGRVVLDGGG